MGFEWKALVHFFGHHEAESISEEMCKAYCEARRAAGRKDGTIRTELGRLRAALRYAAKRGLISRAPSIPRPPSAPPKDIRLTKEQAKGFLDACIMPHVKLFVILAMTTGARMGAILDLTWNRVNFGTGLILNNPWRAKISDLCDELGLQPTVFYPSGGVGPR